MYVENRTKIANFPTPVYSTPPMKGFPVEFGIGAGVSRNQSDGAFRRSKKFSDRFSRFGTIPECDSQPPSHVAVAITLNALAKASSLKTKWISIIVYFAEMQIKNKRYTHYALWLSIKYHT